MLNTRNWPVLLAAAMLLSAAAPAPGVNVWITSGDQSRLFAQQPDIVFGPGGGNTITIDPTDRYQTMEGYGAAVTNSSASLLQNQLSVGQRERLMDDLFSPTEGAGLNYLRLAIGASDFTADGFYTYNDLPAGQTDGPQSNFSLDPDRATILPSLDDARAVNPAIRLMGSPWSAPAWMKTSGSLIGGGLAPQWRGSYATYLRKFAEAYAAEGHPIDSLTLQNEPLFTPGDYPGMAMSAVEQIDLVKNYVGPTFAASRLDTKLIAYDHNWDNTAYPIEVLNDAGARQHLAGTAFHGYAGDVSAQSTVRDAHPDKAIYFTEITGGDFAPDFENNLVWYARNLLIGGARNWGSTVMLWNLALDENSGPHQGGCNDCRGVVTIDSASGAITHNEEFYSLAHASRFVQPGATRIGSNSLDNLLETVAFENPDGSRALLVLNPTGSTQPLRVVDGGDRFVHDVPARSLATFTWTEDDRADFDNGGFESGGFHTTGGSLDGWQAWGVTGDNVAVTDADAFQSDNALRLTEPDGFGGFSGVSQGISVEGGDRLVADASVLLPQTGSLAGTGNQLFMKVEYYSVYGGGFQSPEYLGQSEIVAGGGQTPTGVWLPHQIDSVAPAGAAEARLVFTYARNQNDVGAVLIDNVGFRLVEPLAGDFNADGVVNAADYTVWRDGLGSTHTAGDYDLWHANYGATAPPLAATIPEPTAVWLLLALSIAPRLKGCSSQRPAHQTSFVASKTGPSTHVRL
ncbi:O-Glycosyl hydrolase family 30 [Planctomycetes bacterium MalM25]|nr:O-Glycosyl hydrolase family 30 [Planctomycetes bacterium MalM25]